MHPRLIEHLICPRDKTALTVLQGESLRCAEGHVYPVISGIPVMLIAEADKTGPVIDASLRAKSSDAPWFEGTVTGLTPERMRTIPGFDGLPARVDPVVSYAVASTNGIAYLHLSGKLSEYPIPEIRLPPGDERFLLDIGCNWGRWSIAAAERGYRPVGIDPSLGALVAAQRVARQCGKDIAYVCADARFLPFRDGTFDTVFSYSVIQHFSRANAKHAVREAGRVLVPNGVSLIQMPNKWGLRCLYHQVRRGFDEGKDFEVRYWTLSSLKRLFVEAIGPSEISIDCFFGIGLQRSDLRYMPATHKAAILTSEALRAIGRAVPALRHAADSVYIASRKSKSAGHGQISPH